MRAPSRGEENWMAQSVSDSLLPVLARLSIAAVFIWMGTVKLFAAATSFGLIALLGRWCIGGMMALTAVRDILDFGAAARALGDEGVPAADVVICLHIGLRLLAGWALIIGFWTRLASLVLLALAVITY